MTERERLQRWANAFRQAYGWAPSFKALAGADDVPGAFTCTFEPSFDPIELLGGTGFFRHHPALVAWFSRLGFGWLPEGRIVTAPSPDTLNALLDRWGPPRAGYRLAYVEAESGVLALGPWLSAYLHGLIPIHVAPPSYYEKVFAPRVQTLRGELWRHLVARLAERLFGLREAPTAPHDQPPNLRFHFASVAHDLTVHALNYSAIPWDSMAAMRDAIVAAVPERVVAWRAPGAPGPLTLSMFFDNDLNRYCYAAWSRSASPDDFARVFTAPANHRQLMDALRTRLDETLAGKGDVASADSADLPPLAPTDFTLT